MQVTTSRMKAAWIRDASVPAGQPALGRFDCQCGRAVAGVEFGGAGATCGSCGTEYDGHGWITGAPQTTTELAAIIEASPRFTPEASAYFDNLAAMYGADFTGTAWLQACLKRDQAPHAG